MEAVSIRSASKVLSAEESSDCERPGNMWLSAYLTGASSWVQREVDLTHLAVRARLV